MGSLHRARRAYVRCLLQLVLPLVFAAASLAFPQGATAKTRLDRMPSTVHVPSTTYTSNTTWTLANSPYVLDGNVTVAAGATLTIEPGVIVKFNGQFRSMNINGTLSAIGTEANPITFTSYQDDSAGGDTNGDGGATQPAPGQWYHMGFSSNTSQLKYVTIRYGGYGSAQNYAPIYVYGSGYGLTLDHATVTNNQRSAVMVGSRASVTITNSSLSNNQYGLYVDLATATVDHTTIANNTSRGVWFNMPTFNPPPPATTITASDITQNTGYGVYIGANGDYPLASMPKGSGNNIYANNGNGVQLTAVGYPSFKRADVNWRGNYWGDGVYFWYDASLCTGTSPYSPGHLAYRSSGGNVPAGPIDSGSYIVSPDPNTVYWCGYDTFKIDAGDFSPTKLDTGPRVWLNQTLGVCGRVLNAYTGGECLADPVQSATGNFTDSATDLTLPGAGVPFAFTRSYNSLDLTKGELGQGWADTFAASLAIKSNGDVTARGEDGQQLDFTKQGDGSFVAAAGGLSTLASISGGYELTRHDQVRYRFDAQGRLTSIVDRNSQGLTVAYGADGKVSTVTDAAARQVTFTHNANGLLTGISLPDGRSATYAYTNGLLTSFTDAGGKVWTYTYETHGFLEKEIDPLNHTVYRNVYGADGRVTEQYDALNNKTTFSWDQAAQTASATDARGNAWKDVYANNVLTKRIAPTTDATQVDHSTSIDETAVTAPDGSKTTMTYDGRGNLTGATAPASLGSVQKTFTYDAKNNLTSVTDGRGKTTSYTYDTNGNATSITQDGQTVATYTYNSAGQVLTSTDGRGNTTTNTYDSDGNLASVTDPLGNKTTFTYDSAGRMTSRVDPRGNVQGVNPNDFRTTYTYNAAGWLLTSTDPLGHTTTHTYDAVGNETSVTDANGKTTSYTYDANDRLLTSTAPDAGVTTYTYDATGNQVTAKDPLDHTTTYAYDGNNRLTSITTPLGTKTTFAYDANGNTIKRVEPRGNVIGADPNQYATTFTYDAAGRVLTETDPLGNTTSYTYDAAGNRTSATDANNHTTSYTYDGKNRLVSVTAPGGGVTSYTYDGNGNVVTRTDARSHVTTYVYDATNRLTSRTSPIGQQWTYSYDPSGNVASTVDANGNATQASGDGTTSYSYDRSNRLTSIEYSDSTPDVTYTYDAVGNQTQMTDGAGTETAAYDSTNRLTSVTRGADVFSYAYDIAGDVTRRTYPDGSVADYTYDADSQLATVANGGQTTSYGYDAAGNLTTTTLPGSNGYVETRTYDRAGRLVDVKSVKSGSTLSEFATTLDANGNPTQVVRSGASSGTTTYDYDALDRLTSVCYQSSCPGGSDPYISWTYDAVGNRLTETKPSGTTNYTYDAADELTQAGSTTYAYDHNGNETSAGGRTFAYDLANRVVSTTAGGTTTSYSYDGDGNRLQAADGSQTTNYLWDMNGSLPEFALERDGSGSLIRRYLYGVHRISMTTPSSTSYYHYDQLGSVSELTSSTGQTQWTYAYDPFGATRTETQNDPNAPANPMKFAGEMLDATGVYNLRARQYDPASGRFLAADPASPDPEQPGVSSYAYVADRPTALVDPSGATFQRANEGVGAAELATSSADTLPLDFLSVADEATTDTERARLLRQLHKLMKNGRVSFTHTNDRVGLADGGRIRRMDGTLVSVGTSLIRGMVFVGQRFIVRSMSVVGTHSKYSDSGNISFHWVGRAWDIDKINHEAVVSPGARPQTLALMKLMNSKVGTNLAPTELFCQGNGHYDKAIDARSMKNGRVSPYFTSRIVHGHMDHVHMAY